MFTFSRTPLLALAFGHYMQLTICLCFHVLCMIYACAWRCDMCVIAERAARRRRREASDMAVINGWQLVQWMWGRQGSELGSVGRLLDIEGKGKSRAMWA